MVKLADTKDLKSFGRNSVPVQIRLAAPFVLLMEWHTCLLQKQDFLGSNPGEDTNCAGIAHLVEQQAFNLQAKGSNLFTGTNMSIWRNLAHAHGLGPWISEFESLYGHHISAQKERLF